MALKKILWDFGVVCLNAPYSLRVAFSKINKTLAEYLAEKPIQV